MDVHQIRFSKDKDAFGTTTKIIFAVFWNTKEKNERKKIDYHLSLCILLLVVSRVYVYIGIK